MKQRILMYLYNYYPFESANTSVMLPIIEALKREYRLDIYSANIDGSAPDDEVINGLNVYRCSIKKTSVNRLLSYAIRVYDASEKNLQQRFKFFKKIILKIYHKLIRPEWINKLRPSVFTKTAATLIEKNFYAAVITVSAPVLTHYEILPLAKNGYLKQIKTKWFAYYSDPYATYIGHAAYLDEYMREEEDVYRWADGVFTTPEIAEDNMRYPLAAYAYKTWPLQLANLRQIVPTRPAVLFNNDKINCLYVGSFINLAVRDPSYFYMLIQKCPVDIDFHIVCYFADENSKKLHKQYLYGLSNVHLHQRMSMEECCNLMCAADILVNVGNLCTNQTPSKVFDYIGAGKPIINFYDIKEDTSKKYLEAYPLKLNIERKNIFRTEDLDDFVSFCQTSKGKSVPYQQVKTLYQDCLAENVAKKFIKVFKKELNK